MKRSIRYFSLVLCLCFLFFAFSPAVSAVDLEDYHIYATAHIPGTVLINGMQYPYDGDRETLKYNGSVIADDRDFKVSSEWYLSKSDKTAIFNKGNIVSGKLENLYITGSVKTNVATYGVTMSACSVSVIHTDGSISYIDCSMSKNSNGYYTIDFNFEAEKDVSQIFFQLSTSTYTFIESGNTVTVNLTMGEPSLETEPNNSITWSALSYEIQTAETSWLAKIWRDLTGGFTDMVNSIGNVVNAIIELPMQIWEFMRDGLISLFVPSDEYLTDYKNKWSSMMSENMGAVWQVVDITFGAWEDINISDEQNTIALPNVTIPLPGDNEFSFGGYDVQVVPEGFEFLATALKTVVGGVCTLAFINGLRKRYDEVMGVEK